MRLVRWGTVLGFLGLAAAAQAGTIHPALETEMNRSAPGTAFSVIVHLEDQAPVPELSRELADRRATRAETHETIVEALQATAAASQNALKEDLEGGLRRGEVFGYTSYWISNLFVVHATKEEIGRIAARADVDLVEANFTASLIDPIDLRVPEIERDPDGLRDGPRGIGITPGLYAINAPQAWFELGYTGAGRLVANLDTGVDGDHPALETRWRGYNGQHPWQECWLDVLGGNTQFPVDNYGHGTHVMGTECGAGHASGDTVGVAWEAQWIACNAINQGVGGEFDNDIITAYQWFADPDGDPGTVDDVPDVVQNSWRINENFGQGYTDCDDRWWAVIDNCEAAGCVTTWSAGNEGPGSQTIGSPPDRATTLTNTFSVGAVDATNYDWPY
ncbi:MAG: S8 family serine peptidase, partial [Candidatus Eisenbacteria bacterium]|nr:S8 family serine peptidase [Candidatus Eisenbacteria bacterium]